jgi:hypothetical protein
MASVTNLNKTAGTSLLAGGVAAALVQSLTVVQGSATDVSKKIAGTVYVRMGRTTTISLTGAPVFNIEGSPSGNGGDWVPIYTWTTALHGTPATARTLSANAAAGATSIKMATGALGSCLSTPVFFYNSVVANSEWNWFASNVQDPTLRWSLNNGQSSADVLNVTSFAEQWSIPVDFTGMSTIRVTVDNVWNGVTSPVVVSAVMVATDAASST